MVQWTVDDIVYYKLPNSRGWVTKMLGYIKVCLRFEYLLFRIPSANTKTHPIFAVAKPLVFKYFH